MFERAYARKFMRSVHLLFILIRADPRNPGHSKVLRVFQEQCHIVLNRSGLKKLTNRLMDLEDVQYRKSLINPLISLECKPAKFPLIRVTESLPVVIEILTHLRVHIEKQEFEKAKVMASAVHNYPNFLINECKCSPEEFWAEHICYYSRIIGEDFLKDWEKFFKEFYLEK